MTDEQKEITALKVEVESLKFELEHCQFSPAEKKIIAVLYSIEDRISTIEKLLGIKYAGPGKLN